MNMVRYRIVHRTEYQYSNQVSVCQNQLRMQPVSSDALTCESSEILITPRPNFIHEHRDYFGNRVVSFSLEQTHRSLVVQADSRVVVTQPRVDPSLPSAPWESLLAGVSGPANTPGLDEHRYDSARIRVNDAFAQYALRCFTPGRSLNEAALALSTQIYNEFKYDTTATHVSTTTEEAFELRAGVCQDFAHVQIACMRSIGLPARYVSGYLRTLPPPGKERLIGSDESHAWCEVYAGQGMGWLGLDPTNACSTGMDHVPVCFGRDYDDVCPMRGVILGGGTAILEVSVDVEPIE